MCPDLSLMLVTLLNLTFYVFFFFQKIYSSQMFSTFFYRQTDLLSTCFKENTIPKLAILHKMLKIFNENQVQVFHDSNFFGFFAFFPFFAG